MTMYRCKFYHKCELVAGADVYTPHTCQTDVAVGVPGRSIRPEMEKRVDVLTVTQLEQTANQIWRRTNEEFYLGREGAAVIGLTWDQVIGRVYRARRLHFGGGIHGQIEVEPLAIVAGTKLNFFQFH